MSFKTSGYGILVSVLFLVFLAGCSSITANDSTGILNVDAGDDKSVFVGDTVEFDGSCSVKGGLFQREAEWDFGDGSGEDGMTAIHVYTQPGDYVAEFTVTIIFTITISASDDINVHVSPLPTESFLPANDLGSAGSEEQAIANQRAAVLSDGRIVIAGTAGAGVSPEIAVAVETLPGSRIFRHVARFAHLETKSLPESVKALGNGNIEIKAGDILYDVNPDSGVVNLSLHDVQEPEK